MRAAPEIMRPCICNRRRGRAFFDRNASRARLGPSQSRELETADESDQKVKAYIYWDEDSIAAFGCIVHLFFCGFKVARAPSCVYFIRFR